MALKNKGNVKLLLKINRCTGQNRESIDKTLKTQNKVENPDIRIEGVCLVHKNTIVGRFNTWMDENKDNLI